MNGTFYEQLGGVAGVFEQWGACERTVVACALARKVPWPGLKMLQRAVDAALRANVDDERLERDANDEVLLASLLTARSEEDDEEGGDRLRQLLSLLPFLRTDNERAKDLYMNAAPALVQRYVDSPRHASAASDLCRQLLTYLLVHPALTNHDQRTLTQWLRYLESHISGSTITDLLWQKRIDVSTMPSTNIWGVNNTFRRTIGKNVEFRGIIDSNEHKYVSDPLQESFSKNGRDVDISSEGEKTNFDVTIAQPKSQRSNSLTPPTTHFMQMSSSAENLSDEAFVQKPRSFSLSSEHSLSQLRPISTMYGTTGSETRLDDLRCSTFIEYPGMSMVAQWLKSLRLHKYVWLFTNISYDQMIAMDEEYLEKLGVTKGARHKLLLSIKKLHNRRATLDGMASELMNRPSSAALGRILERLRGVLISPMPPVSDIPAAIVAVLDIASKQLISAGCGSVPTRPPMYSLHEEDHESTAVDPMSLHCWLVEKALHHESFAEPSLSEALRHMRYRLPPRQFFHHVSDMPLNRRCVKQRWRGNTTNTFHNSLKSSWVPPSSSVGPAQPRGKSHSYPPFPPPARPVPPPSAADAAAAAAAAALADEYSSLDALCLQMTEQAIN